MTRNFVLCAALAGACLASLATPARAQDPILAQLYGTGVHQYFSGNCQQAIDDLTQAIDGGTKDPRVYYFRALAEWRQGDSWAAQADLEAGAKMESADVNRYYPVSKSLERVQGPGRLMIEKYRLQARAEAYRREERRNLLRYESQRKAEAEVLRTTPIPPAPGDTTPAPKGGAEPVEKPPVEMPPGEEPAASPPGDDADPFADDPAAAAPSDAMDNEAAPDKDAAPAEGDADAADADAADPKDEMPAEDEPADEMTK